MDLNLAFRTVCLEIDRSELQNVEPEHIELLKKWSNEVQDLMQTANQQMQPPPPQQNMGTPSQQAAPQVGAQQVQNGVPPQQQPLIQA